VLSPSTEQHDLTRERWAYQAIPSLRTVLFVDPDRPVVEILTREAGDAWRSHVVEGLGTSLHLAGLEVALPMVEIYEGAELEPAASIAPAG
jgi:Uma2 family endonuclease